MLGRQTTQQPENEGESWPGEELLPDICVQTNETVPNKKQIMNTYVGFIMSGTPSVLLRPTFWHLGYVSSCSPEHSV